MKVTIGKMGFNRTHQENFPDTTICSRENCGGEARLGFVAHEGIDADDDTSRIVAELHNNNGDGDFWLHDHCAVAVYFCRRCLEPTALYNQA